MYNKIIMSNKKIYITIPINIKINLMFINIHVHKITDI